MWGKVLKGLQKVQKADRIIGALTGQKSAFLSKVNKTPSWLRVQKVPTWLRPQNYLYLKSSQHKLKGDTLLADQLEGGVSTEKAMLDIKRGIMLNLYHESIGMWARATIKNVNMLDSLTGTGIVAFDRVRNLTWKDYKPIAEGRSVIEPHTGNVDTIQMPINSMMYIAQELPETDLIRLKNDPAIRATLIGSMTRTLAASLDGELFELLIAAAAAKKGNVIEMDIPRYVDPIKK